MQTVPVAFLAGGRSPEYEISLRSARELIRVTARDRWQPYLVRLDRDTATWWVRPDPVAPDESDPFAAPEWQPLTPAAAIEHLRRECGVRLVFPALHGPFGEDGAIQGFLQTMDMPFVGSGVAASAVALDKVRMRECFALWGIPIAPACVGDVPADSAAAEREVERIERDLGYPVFAKLDCSGSSIGVEFVHDRAALGAFFARYAGERRRFVVEAAVCGEEISVSVLGNCGEDLEVLPPIGIYPVADDHFTFDAKYTIGACEEVVPPRGMDAPAIARAMALAERCHTMLRCDGVSRTDMIVTAAGPIVLETNTMPGFTESSLMPQSAAHVGISCADLIDRMFAAAARLHGVGV